MKFINNKKFFKLKTQNKLIPQIVKNFYQFFPKLIKKNKNFKMRFHLKKKQVYLLISKKKFPTSIKFF